MLKNKQKLMLGLPYYFWAIAFIVIPLALVIYYGLTDKTGAFTFDNVIAITESGNAKALWIAVKLSIFSTAICLLLAYPLAMILVKFQKGKSSVLVMLFILPMWMNFLLRTMAWQTLLENSGVINTILKVIGLPTINIINTPGAIIFGMVYNFLPFMVLPIYNSLTKIDINVVNAARDLGANGITTFSKITLPLSLPGVISGITMVFVPALTTFVISSILGGNKILLIGNVIEQEFSQTSNWHLGSGLSMVLMVFIVISMIFTAIFDKDGEGLI